MTPMSSLLIFSFLSFSFLSSLSISRAQDRAPHGLAQEHPIAFSPSAFEFFHPKVETKNPCATSNCSPLPTAATVASSLGHESRSEPERNGSRVGPAEIAGIMFGFAFAVLLAIGAYYVMHTRRSNLSRSNSVQPNA